jgi:hypothetical protein
MEITMQAFDLQDTLVRINYQAPNAQVLTQNILNAKILYTPTGQFDIITAQQDNPELHRAISRLVRATYPRLRYLRFVSSSSDNAVAEDKARVIKNLGSSSYTDNNRAILERIKEIVPTIDLLIAKNGHRKRL